MVLVVDVLSWAFIIVGGAFCLIGGLGLLRLPDVFARMHAAGIIDTVGVALVLVGLMLQAGFTLVTVKLIFIIVFIFYTSPVSTHALAQSALSTGIKPQLAAGEEKPGTEGDEPSQT
jgi:multicomponent Na+:H+ antiporter subunit G